MTFPTQDDLRLEVEDDPTGLENLIQNPSGDLGGWGWITPVAGSTLGRNDLFKNLEYKPALNVPNWLYSEPLAVTVGWYVSAHYRSDQGSGAHRARFEFLNSAQSVISSGPQTGYAQAGYFNVPAILVPAGAVYVRLRFDVYTGLAGGNPTDPGMRFYFRLATVAQAATTAAFTTVRTNLVTNPSIETNTAGWSGDGTNSAIARTTAIAQVGAASLAVTKISTSTTPTTVWFDSVPITGGLDYTFQAQVRAATTDRIARLLIEWSNDDLAERIGEITDSTTEWKILAGHMTAPSAATSCRIGISFHHVGLTPPMVNGEVHYIDAVMAEQAPRPTGTYFDGSTAYAGDWIYAWTGTAHASTSTASLNNLAFIEPVPYVNILGPTSEMSIERDELNVSTFNATVWDEALDPAVDNLIRPGRHLRLLVLVGAVWEPLFTGKALVASTKYDLAQPRPDKRTTITLSAVDNAAPLAQASRPEGVATIADLPHVLEGAGIPWNVNGSGNQVPAATIVTRNENATAMDQVAITRDSELGYAWVDRFGVLQVWDRSAIDPTSVITLDETDYSDLDVSFDVDRCINEVRITLLRFNLATGETVEVPYGPYRDGASIDEWGVHAAPFTVQGLTDTETAMAAYAAEIFAANAQPEVRVNSAAIPIRAGDAKALIDLYEMVTVTNADKAITQAARVTKLTHSISPGRWLATLGFSAEGGVASPQITPPVQSLPVGDVEKSWQKAMTSAAQPNGTSNMTLAGLSQTINCPGPGTVYFVGIEAEASFGGAQVNIIELLVDGLAQAPALNTQANASGYRYSAVRTWRITGLAAGAHTFTFRTRNTAAGTNCTINTTTLMTVKRET